ATIRSTPPRRPRWPFSVTLTSYQVGSPWMLEGKMLRGLTGMPMRRKLLAKSSFADAEPEPLTLANLMTKSLRASMRFIFFLVLVLVGSVLAVDLLHQRVELQVAVRRLVGDDFLIHLVRGFADFFTRNFQF